MDFQVPPLPYDKDALAPAMSRETLEFHYEKHHKGYMTKLRSLLEGKPEAGSSLVDVIKGASGGVFNNAAQVYNHNFFWRSMKPGGGTPPTGDVGAAVNRDFGGLSEFRKAWVAAAMGRFGSGYVWLVLEDGKMKIIDTPNAETPLVTRAVPLLTMDVWEHAYYIDYRNARQGFAEAFVDKLLNWSFVAENLKSAG